MNVLYFSLFSLFCLCCECRGDSALLKFEEAQRDGTPPTKELVKEATLAIIDAIKTTAERDAQQDLTLTEDDDVDLYIDIQTVMQSDLIVLLGKLRDVVSKMPDGDEKNKIQAIIDGYNDLEVEEAKGFIDLCVQAKNVLERADRAVL